MASLASLRLAYSVRYASSYLKLRNQRSIMILSAQRLLPSMLCRIPLSRIKSMYLSLVNWLHGLSSLANEDCFKEEVKRQSAKMKQMFGKAPKVFRNSSLIYSDEIGGLVASMGFKGMLTEGAKHILGWKSPHYVYHCSYNQNLKLLLRDFKLSDDISLRFSNSEWNEYPLFADKYIGWIDALPQEEQVINIFMELSALGMSQPLSSNILEFLKALPACAKDKGITFSTPTEVITKLKSVSQLDVPYPMSWVDEESP